MFVKELPNTAIHFLHPFTASGLQLLRETQESQKRSLRSLHRACSYLSFDFHHPSLIFDNDMYYPSNGYAPQFASDEKQRWNDTTRFFGSKNIPLPNGWGDKHHSPLHQLVTRIQAALANVRRFVGQSWQTQMNRSVMAGSKPLTTRDSGFSTPMFILLCCLWYMTSALSSNTGKVILSQFRYPITLTFIQFGFVAGYCLLSMSPFIRLSRIRMPTKAIVQNTLPMGLFQVGGHMFSSMAISRIPVSTVHTIKVSSNVPFRRSLDLNFTIGTFAPIHRSRLRLPVRRKLLIQDVHLSASVDHRCHACLFI